MQELSKTEQSKPEISIDLDDLESEELSESQDGPFERTGQDREAAEAAKWPKVSLTVAKNSKVGSRRGSLLHSPPQNKIHIFANNQQSTGAEANRG